MFKKILLPAVLGAFTLFTVASCGDSDPCADKVCGTGGTCFEGTCECDPGYELDAEGQCNVLTADKLAGNYVANEDCSLSPVAVYNVSIAKTDVTTIKISKFWELFQSDVVATIESATSLKIARQEPDGDKYFVEGTGTIGTDASGKTTITWNYSVSDESGATPVVDNCNATVYTKL